MANDCATVVTVCHARGRRRVDLDRGPLDTGRRWTVDLWSPPTDPTDVELLARKTICYRSPNCSVILTLPRSIRATSRG